jgi:hypothetical protein
MFHIYFYLKKIQLNESNMLHLSLKNQDEINLSIYLKNLKMISEKWNNL